MKKAVLLVRLAVHVAMLTVARYNARVAQNIAKREVRAIERVVNDMEVM